MASIIITCEHAGHDVPEHYANLIKDNAVLNSHRGWDPGASEVAHFISEFLKVPLYTCKTSRLLIEVNRSLDSPELFSEFTVSLSAEEKRKLVSEIYLPYRKQVEDKLMKISKPVLHLSIHSFTPVLNTVTRSTDIGLLFDPSCSPEKEFCKQLRETLQQQLPGLNIDDNEPYQGTSDGLTTSMRNVFDPQNYMGIEIEINQKYAKDLQSIYIAIAESLQKLRAQIIEG